MLHQKLNHIIRVQWDIGADGTVQVTIQMGSGNAEADEIILETLRRYRWKPALKDGVPCASTER